MEILDFPYMAREFENVFDKLFASKNHIFFNSFNLLEFLSLKT